LSGFVGYVAPVNRTGFHFSPWNGDVSRTLQSGETSPEERILQVWPFGLVGFAIVSVVAAWWSDRGTWLRRWCKRTLIGMLLSIATWGGGYLGGVISPPYIQPPEPPVTKVLELWLDAHKIHEQPNSLLRDWVNQSFKDLRLSAQSHPGPRPQEGPYDPR